VEQHGWLTTLQMVDGLALGETTPGPLIMVVAFVGFVGAWTHVVPGEISPLLGGVLGALTATYFTFLPSFLFILCGAPLIESTRTNLKLNAALTAITAAVVGTIVNLAIFLAGHVFWPRGIQGQVEWEAALIAVVAAVALMRFKVGVIPIVIGSALAGIALSLW
jgi:chromate transporter